MRKITRGASANAGLIFHVFVQDSTSTSGAGKASLAFSDFSCRYIRNGEALSGAITPQDITTIGTYAAPTANTNIRIKAIDNSNAIGLYEVQIHADWVNTTNSCQSLTIYLTASGAATLPIQIPLVADDEQVAKPSNFAATVISAGGVVSADAVAISGDTTAADNAEAFFDGTGYAGTGNTIPTVTTVTNMVTANTTQISGDSVAADNLETMLDGTGGQTLSLGQLSIINGAAQAVVINATTASPAVEIANAGTGVGTSVVSVASAAALFSGATYGLDIQSSSVGNSNAIALTPAGTGYGIGGSLQSLATGAITAGSFAAGAIDAAAIATNAIDADALAANAVAEVVAGVWDEAIAGHLGAGSTGAALNSASSAGDPWSTALPGAYGAGTAGFIIGTNLDARVSNVEADTQNIQSRLPAALVAGRMDSDMTAISGDSVAADNLEAAADGTGFNLGGGAVVAASVTGAVGSVTGAVGSVTGAVGSVTGNVGGNVSGSVGSVAGAVGSVTGNVGGNLNGNIVGNLQGTLSVTERDAVADALLDRANAVETSVTPRGTLRALLSALAGVATGGNTNTIVLKNPAGTTTRCTLTVDGDGSRTASVLNV